MKTPWILGIVLLLVWTGILSVRLYCYQKQMKHLLKELELAQQEETNILFSSAVNIGQTQDVIDALNHLLEKTGRSKNNCFVKITVIGKVSPVFPTISARL